MHFCIEASKPPKPLLMRRKNIYSRAYHKELVRTGSNELARKVGNAAVDAWEQAKAK